MNTKLKQWGAAGIVYGIIALVLPRLTGYQLKIFNLFGEHSMEAAIGAIGIGIVLLLIGSMSGQTTHAADAGDAPEAPPSPSPSGPRACPKCGAAASADDNFCMSCGAPIPAGTPATAPAPAAAAVRPKPKPGGGCMKPGCLIPLILIVGGAAWFFFGGALKGYKAPARTEPGLPPPVAGTLVEFPVDPNTTNQQVPTNVVTQTFDPKPGSATPPSVAAPANSFPPGIDTSLIPQSATTMTSATYRGSDPNSTPVNVHVLQPTNPGIAGQWAQGVAQSTGGQVQNTRVQNPAGQTYEGWSVRSPNVLVFILVNSYAGNIIILYTPQPAGFEATQRLASSVGNNRGLSYYPQISSTYGALPAIPPPGYSLGSMTNFSGDELTSSLNQAQGSMDPQLVQALGQVLQLVRALIPDRGTMAQYRNASGQDKGVLVGDYGSAMKASLAWRLLSYTAGFAMKSNNAAGFDALTFSDSSTRVMVFQKGPFIGLTVVPGNAAESELIDLARSVQF